MAKVIRTGVQVELTAEEEKVFEKVLNILDKLRNEDDVEEWAEEITESGCGINELYLDLDALYRACI